MGVYDGAPQIGNGRAGKDDSHTDGDEQSLAYGQLSIWKLETGAGKEGADLAQRAEGLARSARARNLSAIAKAMAGPAGTGNAYALLFARKYAEAVGLLEALYRETNPAADGQIRTLLAWAYVETSRIAEAASWCRFIHCRCRPAIRCWLR